MAASDGKPNGARSVSEDWATVLADEAPFDPDYWYVELTAKRAQSPQ
jgi:hypothetical protein